MALIISIGYLMSAIKTRHVLCKYCYAKKYAKMATTKFQFAYHLLFRSLIDIHSFFSVLLCVLSSVRPSAINSFVRPSVCSFFRSFLRSFLRSFVRSFVRSFRRSFFRSFRSFFCSLLVPSFFGLFYR